VAPTHQPTRASPDLRKWQENKRAPPPPIPLGSCETPRALIPVSVVCGTPCGNGRSAWSEQSTRLRLNVDTTHPYTYLPGYLHVVTRGVAGVLLAPSLGRHPSQKPALTSSLVVGTSSNSQSLVRVPDTRIQCFLWS